MEFVAEGGVEGMAFGEGDKAEGFGAELEGNCVLVFDRKGLVAVGGSFDGAVVAEVLDFDEAVCWDDEGSAC